MKNHQTLPTPQKGWLPLILIALVTIAVLIVSVISLLSGWETIFQNLFYFPIILACVYYVKRGFVFSMLLACGYFILMLTFSNDRGVLQGALIRVVFFIVVAGVITYLSLIRISTEKSLRESEERYSSLFDNNYSVSLLIDPDTGRIVDANAAAAWYYGYTHDELTSLGIYDLNRLPKETVIRNLQRAKNEKAKHFFSAHYLASGEKRNVEIYSGPITLHGNPLFYSITHDITERRRAEEQLKESEERFRQISESAGEWIWELNADGVYTYSNATIYQILGYTPEEIIGKNHFYDFFVPEERDQLKEAAFRTFASRESFKGFVNVNLHKNGDRVILETSGYPILDDNGNLDGYRGADTDITERKRVEDALARSEELYRSLAEASPDQIFINGRDDTILYVNSAALKLFRLSYDQVVGKPRKNVFPPEIAKTQEASLQKVFETGEHIQSEETIQFGKQELWIDTNLVPLKDDAGNVTSVLGIARDITERKRAEMIIRESEQKFHAIFDATGDGMLLADIETQRFVMANMAIQKLTGYTEAELLNRTISDIHPAADLPFVIGQFERMVRGESDSAPEVPVLRKDGTIFYCDISSSVLVTIHDRQYMLGIFHDITDRKRAEDALRQANKQLNLLSSITRHDILNQLMALKGYLELSPEVIDNPTTLIEYITKEETAANTIEHQIMFTRDYQELGAAAPAWQNVNANIQKAVVGLPMRDVRVDVDRTDLEIFADPLFVKVFYNLVDNALRHGGDQMKTIQVSSQESDRGHTIVFEDDGIGISAEDKKYLFTRGFGKNTGLGLFLTREILGITGITITENGVPGKGARFEIMVPNGAWRSTGKGA